MTTDPSSRPVASRVARFLGAAPGEGGILLLGTAYFFLLLFGYYLLRPLREAFGIARGADKLPWLMTATLAVMFLANPAFAALVSRWPRRRFIPAAYRFLAATLAVFYLLLRTLPAHHTGVGYAFYVWLSVFNLFAVSLFWAFMADGLSLDQGRRLFAFIAAGGTLGAVAGAWAAEALARSTLDAGVPLLAAILCLEGAVACARRLGTRFGLGAGRSRDREPGPGLFEGVRLFASSPYLALIGLYILLFTVTSTLLYLRQGQIVEAAFHAPRARAAAFARIDLWVNLLTLAVQVGLAGRLINRVGLRVVLCIMPLLTLAGFGCLWAMPTFGVLAAFQVARRGLHYAVDRPARETLFIPLGPGEKYKAKPFIDTFVYRTGDLLGTWMPSLLAALALPLGGAALGVSGAWLLAALGLGRLQAARAGAGRAGDPQGGLEAQG